jgi:hypothetical protein
MSRAEIAQSVQQLAAGWTVRESNPGGREIFRTLPHPPSGLQPPIQRVPGISRG